MTVIIQLQYSLADSIEYFMTLKISRSQVSTQSNPTHQKLKNSDPTQPNRWMDPTHDQLCSGICMTGFECLSNCYGSRAVPVGHGSQFRWVTAWVMGHSPWFIARSASNEGGIWKIQIFDQCLAFTSKWYKISNGTILNDLERYMPHPHFKITPLNA